MALIDYVKEEKLKHNILNVIRILLKDINTDKWEPIAEKMMMEWNDIDNIAKKLNEEVSLEILNETAKMMHIDPEDMVVRIKLMYFIAKSEILRFHVLEIEKLFNELLDQ